MENIVQNSNKSNTNPSVGHKAEKVFMCEMCDKTLYNQKKLTQHIDVMLEEKNPFTCDICSYRFSTKSVILFFPTLEWNRCF